GSDEPACRRRLAGISLRSRGRLRHTMLKRSPLSSYLSIPEAAHQVIVHHPNCLHEGITDRRSDKVEPAPAQVLAHVHRFLRISREALQAVPGILDWRAADKLPDVAIETAEFFLDFEKSLGIRDRGLDLQPVAYDAGIVHQSLDLVGFEARDFLRVKAAECFAISLALVEDRGPAQTSLRAFK